MTPRDPSLEFKLILIFDDDLVHYPDFFASLSDDVGGAELVYRPHADDCVAQVRALSPVVVLMDFSMGPHHLSGAQAVSALREHFDSAALPIVGISSDSMANQRMRMAGADDGLVKGAAPARLPRILKVLWDRAGGT